jgi:ABC-type lipopolysaccharide export system ATPase subunit
MWSRAIGELKNHTSTLASSGSGALETLHRLSDALRLFDVKYRVDCGHLRVIQSQYLA